MAEASEPGRLLSIHEAATRLGVCRSTLYELIGDGELPTVKLRSCVRVDPRDVDDLVRRRRRPAGYSGAATYAYFGGTDRQPVTP